MGSYSLSETLKSVYALALTKVFYPGARLIRRPFHIRGRKHLSFGPGFTTGYSCRFDLDNESASGDAGEIRLTLGKNCKIGDNVHIVASERVTIGDDCLMASKIFISDTSHGEYGHEDAADPSEAPDARKLITRPVTIGHQVWIGENAVILPGVTIGDGAVIGANALVNRDVPAGAIVGGIPAKVLKQWNPQMKVWEKV